MIQKNKAKMGKNTILQKLNKYLHETPRDQVMSDWNETVDTDNVGVSFVDFIDVHRYWAYIHQPEQVDDIK